MILSEKTGMPMVMLGGDDVHRRFVKGDVVVELKWYEGEPTMVLYRNVSARQTGAFLIDLRDAHKYAKPNGYGQKTLLRDCVRAAITMGFTQTDTFAIKRIADVILDGIQDLVKMPPEPQFVEDARRPVPLNSELTLKIGDKTVMEAVL